MVAGMRTQRTQDHLDPAAIEQPQPIAADGARRLLTAEDVAAILGVRDTFVYALARRGEIPTVRIGQRYVRFRAGAIEQWIAASERHVEPSCQ